MDWLLTDETIATSTVLVGTCLFAFAFYLVCPRIDAMWKRGSPHMKASITTVAIAAIILTRASTAQAQSITETEGLPRLPSFFKICEEPLPRYCVRPPGLLWFGSIATVERERTVGPPVKAASGSTHGSCRHFVEQELPCKRFEPSDRRAIDIRRVRRQAVTVVGEHHELIRLVRSLKLQREV
jgi:hypothetical protein